MFDIELFPLHETIVFPTYFSISFINNGLSWTQINAMLEINS